MSKHLSLFETHGPTQQFILKYSKKKLATSPTSPIVQIYLVPDEVESVSCSQRTSGFILFKQPLHSIEGENYQICVPCSATDVGSITRCSNYVIQRCVYRSKQIGTYHVHKLKRIVAAKCKFTTTYNIKFKSRCVQMERWKDQKQGRQSAKESTVVSMILIRTIQFVNPCKCNSGLEARTQYSLQFKRVWLPDCRVLFTKQTSHSVCIISLTKATQNGNTSYSVYYIAAS